MEKLVVYCADIGSVRKGNFAWARHPDSNERDLGRIDSLAIAVADDLSSGRSVALGFECPLFLPLPHDWNDLGCARPSEGNRSWSAGAGAGAMATGIVQSQWVLQNIKDRLVHHCSAFLRWEEFVAGQHGLFLWEAFVTSTAKGIDHAADATAAVVCFRNALPNIVLHNAVKCETDVFSLIGAALLRSGWSESLELLRQPCIVIKADPALAMRRA